MEYKHNRVVSEVRQWGWKARDDPIEDSAGKMQHLLYICHLFIQRVTESQLKFSQKKSKFQSSWQEQPVWFKREDTVK